MTRYRAFPGHFLIGVLLLAALEAPRLALASPRLPPRAVPDGLGVNIHFTDPRPGEMAQLAGAGFRWVRMDFSWSAIERTKGRYDFSDYERLMAALKPYHIRPILILDYGNSLYESGAPRTDEARAAFARFAAAAVTHFKNRGIVWEMWNEPNIGFWKPRPNVDEYIALALATGKAIRHAAPHELFVGPGTSGMDFGFIEKCFQAGLLQYWNAVSFHPYRSRPPETAAADFARVRALIAKYAPAGKRIPLIASEWGYSERYRGINADRQGAFLAREMLSNLANGLAISIWYDWHDDGTDPRNAEDRFGVVTYDYQPKPAYHAVQALTGALRGLRFSRRITLPSPDDYCLLFAANGRRAWAVWTTSTQPHTVTIPVPPGGFRVTDSTGSKTHTQIADGLGLSLSLTDAPQYVAPE